MNATQIEREISDCDYEAYLNGIHGKANICGLDYSAGSILRAIDPVAFRCAQADYESWLNDDNPIWECGECGTKHEGPDAEGDAEACCNDEKDY